MHLLDGVKELRYRFLPTKNEKFEAMADAERKSERPLGGRAPDVDALITAERSADASAASYLKDINSARLKTFSVPSEEFNG